MAGSTVGVAGVAGAAPHVKVLVQRVCGPVGCYTSSIVNAIRAAANQPGMVAMNLSLGGRTESTAEKDAIAYATGKGVLVIASAGNSGTNKVACPACDPNAISVASKTGLRGSALRNRLLTTATDIGAVGYDTKFGNGRLNSYRAVTGVSLPAGQ